MNRDRRRAGVSGIVFAVAMLVSFTLFGPKGGHYYATEVDKFVAQGAASLIVSVYLLATSVVGLTLLMAYLSEIWAGHRRQGRLIWGTTLAAGGSFLIGWCLYLAGSTALLAGGRLLPSRPGPSSRPHGRDSRRPSTKCDKPYCDSRRLFWGWRALHQHI
jgi:MFS family permease